MHDEVSDTENIRKNLAIERMIVEGCDILLDTSQTFVRQGKSLSALEVFPDTLTLLPVRLSSENTDMVQYLGGAQSLNHDISYCNTSPWGWFGSLSACQAKMWFYKFDVVSVKTHVGMITNSITNRVKLWPEFLFIQQTSSSE